MPRPERFHFIPVIWLLVVALLAGIGLLGAGDDAAAGSTIYVHGGNCYGNVDIDKPRLTPASSIIECVPA